MKKHILLLLLTGFTFSCSDFGDLNVNPKAPVEVPAESLFANATKNLSYTMTNTSVNSNIFRMFAQHWTETTYVDEANYDLVNRDQPGTVYRDLYVGVIKDLIETKTVINNTFDATIPENVTTNKIASATILEVYTWHVLVDIFGDIPYTEALDSDNVLPVYDNDQDIYDAIIIKLDDAIASIDTSAGSYGASDLVYGGNMALWKKFANSLKLRLAVRVASVDAGKASAMAGEAIGSGVFTSNADNATFVYLASVPNTNPVWDALVNSGRNDYIPANTVVDIMNTLEDPRRKAYFDENLGADTYIGGTYGAPSPYGEHTHLGQAFHNPETPGIFMDYAEVAFLQAEAAELMIHGSSSDAEAHYNNAVQASFDFWDVDIEDYLTQDDVAYSTAGSTWQEKIAHQKWLALFNRGFEAWTTYRQYGFPAMNAPPTSGESVPRRYTYPGDAPSINGENYNAAASAMGGDLKSSKVFWDVN